ncbi:hypothetical protein F5Y05DRAFT_392643 [Hypoxylon sp. FL0543]|nr:hypothetical protein F5Y05DRAFT_392643 [Hypoxylon sp. FL0543]
MASTESNKSNDGVLYFAYGSNLSPTQMQVRCPSSAPIGLAHLPGWTWLINERGYANIVQHQTPVPLAPPKSSPLHLPSPPFGSAEEASRADLIRRSEKQEGKESANEEESESGTKEKEGVYGVLYRMDPDDEATLDSYEGVPWAYERRFVEVSLVSISAAKTTHEDETGNSPQNTKKMETVPALVYVDFKRVLPSVPNREYVNRMNRGIREATERWGLPKPYVDVVMRPFIPAMSSEEGETG